MGWKWDLPELPTDLIPGSYPAKIVDKWVQDGHICIKLDLTDEPDSDESALLYIIKEGILEK
jgi:hypothetical protein